MLLPRIAEVSCHPIKLEAGDRLLVRTTHRLNNEEKQKLRNSIIKWAGVEVEVFIYCILDMEIEVDEFRK